MTLPVFYLRAFVFIISLVFSWYAMEALNFEKLLKPGHIVQARILYGMAVIALAYLCAQFVLGFLYRL